MTVKSKLLATAACLVYSATLFASFDGDSLQSTNSKPADLSASVRAAIDQQRSLVFEQNQGQFDRQWDYVAKGSGYTVGLGPEPVIELVRYRKRELSVSRDAETPLPGVEQFDRFQIRLIGANQTSEAKAQDKVTKLTHYLTGKQSEWTTDVPSFGRVRYSQVFNDIDVEYYGNEGRLEYDFIVQPGGNPETIRLSFEGADEVRINDHGELVISLGDQEIVQKAPLSYQKFANDHSVVIESSYRIDNGIVGFELAKWDRSRPLIIDPVLEYSRYYGGPGSDFASSVNLDSSGNIYVIGTSSSFGLATSGSYDEVSGGQRLELSSYPSCSDCTDSGGGAGQVERTEIMGASAILVTKFSPNGQTVLWSTYLSSTPDQSLNIGLNSTGLSDSGEAAFGITDAPPGLPLVNSTQSHASGESNAWIGKLNAAGSGLVFGTYLHLGDGFYDWLRGLDVSSTGEVAATGALNASNTFPVVTGIPGQSCILNAVANEVAEGWVALFSTSGTLTFSSCLGGDVKDGTSREALRGVTIHSNGHLYVTGYSSMTDFPMVNPIQATKNVSGAREMTISEIDPGDGSLDFSTWYGPTAIGYPPTGWDSGGVYGPASTFWANDIKVDSEDNIIVVGAIASMSFPAINAIQPNMQVPKKPQDFVNELFGTGWISVEDLFLVKLHPTNGVIFSTYLGGSRAEVGIPVLALDSSDNIYIAGISESDDFPLQNPILASKPGGAGLTLSKVTPDGALALSTFLGGSGMESNSPGGVAVDSSGKIIMASHSSTADIPIVGPVTSHSGGNDIVLLMINQSGDTDTDGDGVPDAVDPFDSDDTEWRDTDNDLTGDNADTDDDEDGELDATDRFPKDPTETADADEDGAGDNRDEFDADLDNYFDLDGDGLADFDDLETDRDGDGANNDADKFDFDKNETTDYDNDGTGDKADLDDDGDLMPDLLDPAPLDPDIPLLNFETYSPWDTSVYKSPWPDGFNEVAGTDMSWTSATDQAFSGERSFSSRIIDHSETAAIEYTATFEAGYVEFRYKVSSQASADLFTFSVDDTVILTDSGDSGWLYFMAPVTAGEHTLEWRYAKDASVTEGFDAAWIDDFRIVGGNTIIRSGFE